MSGSYPDFSKDFAIKEVEVKSHDGVLVPLSIYTQKNIKYDGNNLVILQVMVLTVVSTTRLYWCNGNNLEQGCCIALHTLGFGKKEKNGIGQEWKPRNQIHGKIL